MLKKSTSVDDTLSSEAMAKFIVVLAALVAVAYSSVVPVVKEDNDYSSFAYDVADPNTGDYKSQVESRVGGTVKGQYSLVDPDGTQRVVDYTADDVNGFNAVVQKNPLAVAASAPAVVQAKTVYSAPVVTKSYVAPQFYSAPTAVVAKSYVTPQVYATPSVYAASAPIYAKSYVAPQVYAAPSTYFASTPVVGKSYVAPQVYSSPSVYSSVYAPGLVSSYSSPYYSGYVPVTKKIYW
ncbi:cuticle protein 21-like [Melitaea cinxia]|uniref:cuticle protein 21-like n=1 Tax=Melitaea cinxia TaxID=113334 RepID=UPI001E26FA5B|nr:cuticle protein 21-like [Melitaea cinxia]